MISDSIYLNSSDLKWLITRSQLDTLTPNLWSKRGNNNDILIWTNNWNFSNIYIGSTCFESHIMYYYTNSITKVYVLFVIIRDFLVNTLKTTFFYEYRRNGNTYKWVSNFFDFRDYSDRIRPSFMPRAFEKSPP